MLNVFLCFISRILALNQSVGGTVNDLLGVSIYEVFISFGEVTSISFFFVYSFRVAVTACTDSPATLPFPPNQMALSSGENAAISLSATSHFPEM